MYKYLLESVVRSIALLTVVNYVGRSELVKDPFHSGCRLCRQQIASLTRTIGFETDLEYLSFLLSHMKQSSPEDLHTIKQQKAVP